MCIRDSLVHVDMGDGTDLDTRKVFGTDGRLGRGVLIIGVPGYEDTATEVRLRDAKILVVSVSIAGDFDTIVPVQRIDALIELKVKLDLVAAILEKHGDVVTRPARKTTDDEPAELRCV